MSNVGARVGTNSQNECLRAGNYFITSSTVPTEIVARSDIRLAPNTGNYLEIII